MRLNLWHWIAEIYDMKLAGIVFSMWHAWINHADNFGVSFIYHTRTLRTVTKDCCFAKKSSDRFQTKSDHLLCHFFPKRVIQMPLGSSEQRHAAVDSPLVCHPATDIDGIIKSRFPQVLLNSVCVCVSAWLLQRKHLYVVIVLVTSLDVMRGVIASARLWLLTKYIRYTWRTHCRDLWGSSIREFYVWWFACNHFQRLLFLFFPLWIIQLCSLIPYFFTCYANF